MASPKQEIEVIDQKTLLTNPANLTALKQNLYWHNGMLAVREGFGVLSEFNSSLQAWELTTNGTTSTRYNQNTNLGLQECLGNFFYRTDFGHEQIISVFKSEGIISSNVEQPQTALTAQSFRSTENYVTYYSVFIHDLTNNTSVEKILYTHTSEKPKPTSSIDSSEATWYHGYYETRQSEYGPFESPKVAGDERFWFCQYSHPVFGDQIYFGSKDTDAYVYNPSIFYHNRPKAIQVVPTPDELNDWESGMYSEDATLVPVALKNGIFKDGFAYIQADDMPNFVDATVLNGVVIYASGKSLYFSDVGDPNAIIGDNVINVVAETDIVAIEGFNNFIIVWTDHEMFVYQPSWSASLLSAGSITEIATNVGCLHALTVTKTDLGVFWADKNNFYRTGNGYNIDKIGEPINAFFTQEFPSPFINYFQENGGANPSGGNTPDFVMTLKGNTKGIHTYYNEKYKSIFFVVPELNIAWVFNNNDWMMWNWNSLYQANSKVGMTSNLKKQHLVGSTDRIFGIGGKTQVQVKQPYIDPSDSALKYINSYTNNSFCLTEWGRGGALDRSSAGFLEDNRTIGEGYTRALIDDLDEEFVDIWYDRAFPKRSGWSHTDKQVSITPDEKVYAVPVRFTIPPQAGSNAFWVVPKFRIKFKFDSGNWEPLRSPAGNANCLVLSPPERSANSAQILGGCGVGSNLYELDFIGVPANSTWGGIAVNGGQKTTLAYVLMKQKGDATANTNTIVLPGTTTVTLIETTIPGGGTNNPGIRNEYIWTRGAKLDHSPVLHYPVDWFFKTGQVGLDGPELLKTRGLYIEAVSHGPGDTAKMTETISDGNWIYGLLNAHAGTDYKDYVSQLVDFTGTGGSTVANIQNLKDKVSIRQRVWTSAAGLEHRTFNTTLTWGDTTNNATGNFLVDTEELDTLAMSTGVKGHKVNYTVFGFIFDNAQRLYLQSIKMTLQRVAGRRRIGR